MSSVQQKPLEVGEVLYENGDGPYRLYYAPAGTQLQAGEVVWELTADREFVVIQGESDGYPPATLTVVSVGSDASL